VNGKATFTTVQRLAILQQKRTLSHVHAAQGCVTVKLTLIPKNAHGQKVAFLYAHVKKCLPMHNATDGWRTN
jgi:hypothetical protein